MKKRTICVATGSRAEYGYLRPVMREILKSRRLRLKVVLAGMHLRHEHGQTENYLRQDGFRVDARVETYETADTGAAMARGISKGIARFTDVFEKIRPDIILILGDRVEPFAAAISGAFLNIPVAQIHGGDTSQGGYDDFMRHAITKLAHIHFPATQTSARRVLRLGENPRYVFQVGSPSIDEILQMGYLTKSEVESRFQVLLTHTLLVLLQHSVSTQWQQAPRQMEETLRALARLNHQTVIIYPNSDAGGRAMIRRIERYRKNPNFRIYKSLSRLEYLSLLKCADVLVGNSSSGMIESSSFKIPVVNIGTRQKDRERGPNVIDAPHETGAIVCAIRKTLSPATNRRLRHCRNPYGDGHASKRIVKALETIHINRDLLEKQIAY